MKAKHILTALAATLIPFDGSAQHLLFDESAEKSAYIMPAQDTIAISYNNDMVSVPIMANCKFTAEAPASDWLNCVQEANGNLTLTAPYYFDALQDRYAIINLNSADGSYTRKLVVKQSANNSATELTGDTQIQVASATADQSQSGEGINNTFDNDYNTIWHSPYNGTRFPLKIVYTLKEASHVDYLLYTPRQSGTNGEFGRVTVEYALASAQNTWVKVTDANFNEGSSASRVDFGENGVDDVKKVRVTVNSGKNGFASCAEMGFYTVNSEMADLMARYFKDGLCSQLKDGITEADEAQITNPYFRQLVHYLRTTDYSTKYRVGEFPAYRPLSDLNNELHASAEYCRYENPTGIYFEKNESLVLFVEGLGSDGASLIIKSFGENRDGENHPESSYPLANGMNVIKTRNRGNGYISYFTPNYATAPKVKIHFAMATENGYFDLQRGDTNEDWVKLLANATSDIIDVRTERMQVAVPVETVRRVTPKKGVELATIYDNVIFRQHEILGLDKYNHQFTNRQFARPVDSGMFADGTGAAAAFGSFAEWCNADNFGFWGFGHELGHNNQIAPGAKWSGCGETTNNIYASWVEHKLGNGYHRLEDEGSGINDYSGMRGGRFQIYLEEGVRKGVSWQLQDGADYHGTTPNQVTVPDEDFNGNRTGKNVTTTSRNYDHFVKVVPLYQLALYTQDAGKALDAYGTLYESVRNENAADRNLSNGQLQVKFMKRFCDAAKLNLLPFFEKAGMFKPIEAYIEDYSAGWIKINQAMLDEVTKYVEGKGYPLPPAALNYINAYNLDVFRNEAKLEGNTLNAGCSLSGTKVTVDHSKWKNVVGFETYNDKDELVRITMYGLGGSQKSKNQTKVLFPSGSSYIMAVGYDGTRIKCFQK